MLLEEIIAFSSQQRWMSEAAAVIGHKVHQARPAHNCCRATLIYCGGGVLGDEEDVGQFSFQNGRQGGEEVGSNG